MELTLKTKFEDLKNRFEDLKSKLDYEGKKKRFALLEEEKNNKGYWDPRATRKKWMNG